jgi:CheY-like chemotaxis protein
MVRTLLEKMGGLSGMDLQQRLHEDGHSIPIIFLTGHADLPDIRFGNASYWATAGSMGFKANVAPKVLVNFNMRFDIGGQGLSDRIAPLVGVEWAF